MEAETAGKLFRGPTMGIGWTGKKFRPIRD